MDAILAQANRASKPLNLFLLPALGLSSFGYEIAGYEIARLRVDIVEAT